MVIVNIGNKQIKIYKETLLVIVNIRNKQVKIYKETLAVGKQTNCDSADTGLGSISTVSVFPLSALSAFGSFENPFPK